MKKYASMIGMLVLSAACAFGQDALIEQYAGMHGSIAIKQNLPNGEVGCVVIGYAEGDTLLGKAAGLAQAGREAKLNGEAAFVEWCKREVHSVQKDGQTVLRITDGSTKDGTSSSSHSEKSHQTLTEGEARGLVSGISWRGDRVKDMGDGTFTMVLVGTWSPSMARGAYEAVEAVNGEVPAPTCGTGGTTPIRSVDDETHLVPAQAPMEWF